MTRVFARGKSYPAEALDLVLDCGHRVKAGEGCASIACDGGRHAGRRVETHECLDCIAATHGLAVVLPPARPAASAALPRIRVGIVTPALYLGGAERWILTLLAWCDRARIDWVGVAALDPNLGVPEIVAEVRQTCPVLDSFEAMLGLADRVDVLLTWGVPDMRAHLGPHRRCKVVMVSHGCHVATSGVLRGCEDADALAAVSRVAVGPFLESQRSRVRIIPNGVDPARVVPTRSRAEVRAAWGVPLEVKVLGCLQRKSPEKNPLALASAVRKLPDRWVGVMVGDGLGADFVHAHAASAAPGRVAFPGVDLDVGSVLGAFDAFLLPSFEEGASLALIEAWMAGVPAVATPVGLVVDHPELVRVVSPAAEGSELAEAVLLDELDPAATTERIKLARFVALDSYRASCFGAAWTRYLCDVARQPSYRITHA